MALDEIAILGGVKPPVATGRSEALPAAPQPVVEASAPVRDVAATKAQPSPPDLSRQLEKLTRALQESQSNLSISVDGATGKTIVRIFRSSTGELVRQIPSEEAIAIAASIDAGEPLGSLGFDWWS
jgi:flagellar protein FlaG